MIVVSDSGPLISLMKAGRLELLYHLYGEVLIPEAVYSELTGNRNYQAEAEQIDESSFIRVVTVKERKAVAVLQRVSGLDLGESEAIIYADDAHADVLLMEEAAGRQVAKAMGISVRGSLGVLLLGYDKGLISAAEVEAAVEQMQVANRRISKDLVQFVRDYVK